MKRIASGSRTVVFLCLICGVMARESAGQGPRYRGGLTMLVVPARVSVVQVALDVLDRYPAVLVTYQHDRSGGPPLLHAWNGENWVYVTNEDYRTGRFVEHVPARAVLVGDENSLPDSLVDDSAWCPKIMGVPTTETPTLINSLGQVFQFTRGEWRWFARRYNLELLDLSRTATPETSWYDQSFFGGARGLSSPGLPPRMRAAQPTPTPAPPPPPPPPPPLKPVTPAPILSKPPAVAPPPPTPVETPPPPPPVSVEPLRFEMDEPEADTPPPAAAAPFRLSTPAPAPDLTPTPKPAAEIVPVGGRQRAVIPMEP